MHKIFVPWGQTANQDVYKSFLQSLKDSIRRRCPEFRVEGKWFILQENALPHTALTVKRSLSVHEVTVLPHEPHYPDLSPCDFFFFSRLKRELKDHRFADIEAIQTTMTKQLCSYSGLLKAVFLNREVAARYRALASIKPGRKKFSWKLSF